MSKKVHRNALPAGYELHWFRIENVLGHGGFGLTYIARDVNLDRRVAIKEYMPSQISMRESDMSIQPLSKEDEEDYLWGLNRFISEARNLTRFEHPNLVRVFNVFEANNSAYMVMSYEQGRSLKEILKKGYRFSEDDLLRLLFPLMDGLESVHNKGFVHRDIKPGNIFIRMDGGPVLLDFGSARQTWGGMTTRTLTNFVSPGYAPIEQYIGKSDRQGPWTDIYGLGATAYEAITGNMPEAAVDRSAMISSDAGDNLIKASLICKDSYSTKLLKAIDHSLAFNIQDRPQTIAEWRKEFDDDSTLVDALRVPRPPADTFTITEAVGNTEPITEVLTRKDDNEIFTDQRSTMPLEPELSDQVRQTPARSRYLSTMITIGAVGALVLSIIGYHAYMNISRETIVQADPAGNPSTPAEGVSTSTNVEVQVEKPRAPTREERIAELLDLAGQDIAALRLMSPQNNNAYDKYLRVLSLDQDNKEAVRGIDTITDTYLQLVNTNIESGDLEKAQQYLEKADYLRPGQSKVISVQKALDEAIKKRDRAGSPFGKIKQIFR